MDHVVSLHFRCYRRKVLIFQYYGCKIMILNGLTAPLSKELPGVHWGLMGHRFAYEITY
jgi:hypothetical protein